MLSPFLDAKRGETIQSPLGKKILLILNVLLKKSEPNIGHQAKKGDVFYT